MSFKSSKYYFGQLAILLKVVFLSLVSHFHFARYYFYNINLIVIFGKVTIILFLGEAEAT